jgi:hypothetical protein
LESDVNIKLVASLRQKVKAKVKASLDAIAADKTKENNRKNLVQKVCQPDVMLWDCIPMYLSIDRQYLMNLYIWLIQE